MRDGRTLLISLWVVGLLMVPALADDLNPPPWRGEEATTFARWEFSYNDYSPPPDAYSNPYGPPELTLNPDNTEWYPSWEERFGVWALSGELWVDIPNYPEPRPFKDIWVQVTWIPLEGGATPFPNVWEIETPGGPYWGSVQNEDPVGPGDWRHSTYLLELSLNPDSETIWIWGDIIVDELVIDTRCFPEPASLILLLLGSFTVLRRR